MATVDVNGGWRFAYPPYDRPTVRQPVFDVNPAGNARHYLPGWGNPAD
jgi:hypothetical protein